MIRDPFRNHQLHHQLPLMQAQPMEEIKTNHKRWMSCSKDNGSKGANFLWSKQVILTVS